MKRQFSKRFKLLVQRLAILGMILATLPISICEGDCTATVFLAMIGIPSMFSDDVKW